MLDIVHVKLYYLNYIETTKIFNLLHETTKTSTGDNVKEKYALKIILLF